MYCGLRDAELTHRDRRLHCSFVAAAATTPPPAAYPGGPSMDRAGSTVARGLCHLRCLLGLAAGSPAYADLLRVSGMHQARYSSLPRIPSDCAKTGTALRPAARCLM